MGHSRKTEDGKKTKITYMIKTAGSFDVSFTNSLILLNSSMPERVSIGENLVFTTLFQCGVVNAVPGLC